MSALQLLTFVFLSFVLNAAFVNCGGSFEATSSYGLSAICTEKLRSSKPIVTYESAEACESASDYECERRVFRPGAGYGRRATIECFLLDNWKGEICVNVQVHSFDTAPMVDSSAAEEIQEGGEYNREEIRCSNSKVSFEGLQLISESSDFMSAALEGAIRKCRKGAQL